MTGLFALDVEALLPLAPATVGLLPQLELVLPAVPAPWAFVAPVAVVPDVPEPDVAAPAAPVDVPEPEVPVEPEPPDPEPPPAPWANADVAMPSASALTVSNFSTLCFLSICWLHAMQQPQPPVRVRVPVERPETREGRRIAPANPRCGPAGCLFLCGRVPFAERKNGLPAREGRGVRR